MDQIRLQHQKSDWKNEQEVKEWKDGTTWVEKVSTRVKQIKKTVVIQIVYQGGKEQQIDLKRLVLTSYWPHALLFLPLSCHWIGSLDSLTSCSIHLIQPGLATGCLCSTGALFAHWWGDSCQVCNSAELQPLLFVDSHLNLDQTLLPSGGGCGDHGQWRRAEGLQIKKVRL